MNIKLYQIKKEIDGKPFSKMLALQKFYQSNVLEASMYEKALQTDMNEEYVSDIAEVLRNEGHPLLCGSPFGITDVIVTEKGSYLLDVDGIKLITFKENEVKPREDFIKVLYVEPGREPYVTEISKDYRAQQKAVQGLVEYIYNSDETIFVVNEEHKINGMQGNRRLVGDVIAGPFFIAGDTGEDLCSLTDEQVEYYRERFLTPEDISQEEINNYIFYQVKFEPNM